MQGHDHNVGKYEHDTERAPEREPDQHHAGEGEPEHVFAHVVVGSVHVVGGAVGSVHVVGGVRGAGLWGDEVRDLGLVRVRAHGVHAQHKTPRAVLASHLAHQCAVLSTTHAPVCVASIVCLVQTERDTNGSTSRTM